MSLRGFVGIDPGLTGAVAIVYSDGRATIHDTPTIKNAKGKLVYDYYGMHKLLKEYSVWAGPLSLSLEKQQAMPKQGVSSTFQTGVGYGAWLAFCWALVSDFEIVGPRKWKKALGLTSDKEQSRALAIKLYPALADQLKRKRDHNRAEALLLAHFTKLERTK